MVNNLFINYDIFIMTVIYLLIKVVLLYFNYIILYNNYKTNSITID